MSEGNLEQRVAQLEKAVHILLGCISNSDKTHLMLTKGIIEGRKNCLAIMDLLLKIHPELRDDKIVGFIHSRLTQAECDDEELLGVLKKLRPSEPPTPGSEPPKV